MNRIGAQFQRLRQPTRIATYLAWLCYAWLLSAAATANDSLTCYSTLYPPYVLQQDGEITGIDVEVIRAAAERIGIAVKFELEPWRRLESALRAGERDCVFAYFRTPEREQYALFTGVPLHVTQYALFVRTEDLAHIQGLADLQGRRVGVNRGFKTPADFAEQVKRGHIQTEEVTQDQQSLRMLSLRRLDAVLTNQDVGLFVSRELKQAKIALVEPPLSTTPAYLVFRRDPTFQPLVEAFNRELFELLRDGSYQRIYDRFMELPASP